MSKTISTLLRFKPAPVEELLRCRRAVEEWFPVGQESEWPNLHAVAAAEGLDIKMARWVFQEILTERAEEIS